MINIHKIIADDTSVDMLIDQLIKYCNDETFPEPIMQYRSYINNYNKNLDNNNLNFVNNYNKNLINNKLNFVKDLFNNDFDILNLPRKNIYDKNNWNNILINKKSLMVNGKSYKDLKTFIEISNYDPKLFFISVFGFIMNKYSGQEFIYTSLINQERTKYTKKIIGPFNSIQPLLINYSDSQNNSLNNVFNRLNVYLNQYENEDISFTDLSKTLNLLNMNNGFIFESSDSQPYNCLNLNFKEKLHDKNNLLMFLNKLYNFEFIFKIIDKNDNYDISIEYNGNLYDENMISNIMDSFVEVIQNTGNFDKRLSDIEYINPEEKNKILYSFNSNNYEYENMLYHVEFSKIAKKYSDKCILIFENKEFTYKDVDNMSNSLANYLRTMGVKRNEVVPIISERSYHLVIAALAILKAGGAFLFIDYEFPKDRIQYMISEVNAKIVLEYLPSKNENKIFDDNFVYEYNLNNHNYDENIFDVPNVNCSDDICCIFFTSGTTGKPKGILLNHDNVINCTFYSLTRKDKENLFEWPANILAFTKVTFIIYLVEIFLSLINQMTIILCNEKEYNNPILLADLITKYKIESAGLTNTRIKYYIRLEKFRKSLTHFKVMIFGGEPLTSDVLQMLIKYTDSLIFYSYALTETSGFGCIDLLSRSDIINNRKLTIGRPNCNVHAYILDANLKPVPIGVDGEIYLSGRNICNGYLNLENINNKNFIDCPYSVNPSKKEIMYKTGDIGKWSNDGKIIHLGRKDFQVKIRGQRIELLEIEKVMKEIKELQDGVVIDKVNKDNNEKYLVGYYISKDDININYIRDHLRKKLPLYMIPKFFIKIDKIPLTSHDKLNRKALPEPDINDILSQYTAPETETEKRLCKIYSIVFQIPENKIGRTNDFFDMGGDSLNAIRISSMIEKEFQIKFNIKDVFHYSQIWQLGKYIEELLQSNNIDNKIDIIKKRNIKEFPITSQQLGVYLDSIKYPNSIMYNLPFSYKLNNGIDIEKIKEGLNFLFDSQEIFKTKYLEKYIDGKIEIYGYIDDECKLEFEEYNYENIKSFIRPFDLSKAPLIRVGFIGNEMLLIDTHHIISDGSTSLIISNELNKYYNENEISKLDIQFSDYAIYMNEKKNNGSFDNQIDNPTHNKGSVPKRQIISRDNIYCGFNCYILHDTIFFLTLIFK